MNVAQYSPRVNPQRCVLCLAETEKVSPFPCKQGPGCTCCQDVIVCTDAEACGERVTRPWHRQPRDLNLQRALHYAMQADEAQGSEGVA